LTLNEFEHELCCLEGDTLAFGEDPEGFALLRAFGLDAEPVVQSSGALGSHSGKVSSSRAHTIATNICNFVYGHVMTLFPS
jgi:hypothetical protein